jgi:glycosyltransferase involved in cell wall biosynthesis
VTKNIWIINQFAGTPTSGWGERHYYFSKNWIKQGYNVTIISGSYNHVFNELPNAPNQFNIENVEGTNFCWVKTPKYNPKSILRFWSFMVFAIKVYFSPIKLIGKPDIIVVSSMPIFPVLTGYWLKLRYNAKAFLFEIRDIWPLTLILLGGVSKNHPAARLIGWFEKFGYKKADKVVSLLPNAKSHIEEIAKAGSKFVYIPNGLDEGVLNKELAPLEYLEQIPTDRFVIGYTGTLGLANALEYFVEAAGLLKDDPRFFFVIVGEGYLKEELMNQSKEFGNILFFPKVRKNQVASFLQKFDLCFVGRNDTPLFKHGVSANKYFDYMLASKPILDSNNLIKDPVELSGCGLIVKPDSADTIKEGIILMHSLGSEELMLMGQKGKEFVKEFHNITFLSNEYVKLFQNYLKQ